MSNADRELLNLAAAPLTRLRRAFEHGCPSPHPAMTRAPVPDSWRHVYDVRHVIGAIVDEGATTRRSRSAGRATS